MHYISKSNFSVTENTIIKVRKKLTPQSLIKFDKNSVESMNTYTIDIRIVNPQSPIPVQNLILAINILVFKFF